MGEQKTLDLVAICPFLKKKPRPSLGRGAAVSIPVLIAVSQYMNRVRNYGSPESKMGRSWAYTNYDAAITTRPVRRHAAAVALL
jgi:hypothetical protein